MFRTLQLGAMLAGLLLVSTATFANGAASERASLPQSCTEPTDHDQREACAQDLYELGAAALARREPRQALALLQASLQHSDDPITRADLGRAHLALQQFEQARTQFERALAADPPPEARALLLRFLDLAQQERTQTSGLQWRLSVARMHDSNVNAGPRDATVTLWGLPFTLSPQSLQQADHASLASVSALHWNKLGERLHWQTEASVAAIQYDRQRAYDLGILVIESGPVIDSADGNWLFHAGLRHTRVTLGDIANFHASGWAPTLRMRGGERLDWLVQTLLEQRTHDVNDLMSATIRQMRVAAPWRLLSDWTFEPSALVRRESARDPAYSQTQSGIGLGVRGSVIGTRVAIEWTSIRARYEAPESWADQARRDRRHGLALLASRALGAGFYLKASVARQQQLSVLEFYQTRRSQSMLELSRDF